MIHLGSSFEKCRASRVLHRGSDKISRGVEEGMGPVALGRAAHPQLSGEGRHLGLASGLQTHENIGGGGGFWLCGDVCVDQVIVQNMHLLVGVHRWGLQIL